jgi:hypothetical protein
MMILPLAVVAVAVGASSSKRILREIIVVVHHGLSVQAFQYIPVIAVVVRLFYTGLPALPKILG